MDTKRNKDSKICRKIALLGLFFSRQKRTKTPRKKQNHQTTPKNKKNTFLHVGKQSPIFKFVVFFFKMHSFISAKLCFAENTIEIVFSAEHSFCVSQIVKPPLEAPSQNGTFEGKRAILGFPLCPQKPLFL